MSTDPFETPQMQSPTANVALIQKPEDIDAGTKFMQTIVENVKAESASGGRLEDDEFIYSVIHSSERKMIDELLQSGYEGAPGHPYNSSSSGNIVLKISKEVHGLKYKTEAHTAERRLRKVKEEGGDISADKKTGVSAKFSESQSVKEILDRLPDTEREADIEAIRRFNPNAVDLDDDQ
jgi:hypothetical protein